MADQKPIIISDGNQTLTTVDRVRKHLSDNPADYPKLTAAHLMRAPLVGVRDERLHIGEKMDGVMSRDLRATAVGAGMFKYLRDASPILLHEVYLLGRYGFVRLMQSVERPDSMADGLTQRDYELAWEVFENNVKLLAKKGQEWRKRNAHI